ncbi:P1 family peptidase [Roseobacter litoralis]|uniref:P1 family peptidase n=1 Tax=Roseobacter litoralis TaxID=42443 RepID=UPI000160EA8B|nr:P1 family peptidase [Roseobacter litoralis]
MRPGPRNLITDVAGLRVGNAQDDRLKSGTTVLTADAPFTASVHVMGGAPGTRETDLLAPDKSVASVDALVLSGGSAFGLEACSGVVEGLRAMGRGFVLGSAIVPIVPGAILFDLTNGGAKDWDTNPYSALGRRALETASALFEIGTTGAGTGATTATLKGGLGSASLVMDNGITVGALVAANPFGAVTTPGSRHFFAAPYEMGDEFAGLGPDPTKGHGLPFQTKTMHGTGEGANTTIAIVATDAALDKAQCQRMAIAAHDGMARAVVPSHTPMDGDLVFAAAMGAKPLKNPLPDLSLIGHGAALCLARAIARAVYAATPKPGDLLPSWQDLSAP